MKRNRRIFLITAIAALLLVFVFSGYKVLCYFVNSKIEANAFDKLAEMKESGSDEIYSEDGRLVLKKYGKLYQQNTDLFGWITIPDTELDYPVMYTPEDPEFYLRKAFDKSYSQSGVPFLDAECFYGCGNYIVYGHNMNNGSMFASVLKYEDKEYWQAHRIINFDSIHRQARYEVVAAFRTKIQKNENNDFQFYKYTDLTNEEKFKEYMEYVGKVSLYDTNIEAEFGDELLTLSTCSYHTTDGRFVVVAKEIK